VAETGCECRPEQQHGQSEQALAPHESFLRNAINATEILPPAGPVIRIAPNRFQVPVMRGIIERRILVNFRCDQKLDTLVHSDQSL
jgi:hypothetical protein